MDETSSRSSAYLPSNFNIHDKYTNCSMDNLFPDNQLDLSLNSVAELNVDVLYILSSSTVHESIGTDNTLSTYSSTNNVCNDTGTKDSLYAHDTVYQDQITKQKIHDSIVMNCSRESKIMFDAMINREKLSSLNILSYISSPFKGEFYNFYFDKHMFPTGDEFSVVGYNNLKYALQCASIKQGFQIFYNGGGDKRYEK